MRFLLTNGHEPPERHACARGLTPGEQKIHAQIIPHRRFPGRGQMPHGPLAEPGTSTRLPTPPTLVMAVCILAFRGFVRALSGKPGSLSPEPLMTTRFGIVTISD